MRMWKRAIAVALTSCICFIAPVQGYAQTKGNDVVAVTATAKENTVEGNTKKATSVNNKNTKKTTKKSQATKTASKKATAKKTSSVKKKSKKSTSKKYLGTFKAYAYNIGGTTASGTKTKANRTVAVDPNVIPLGSKLIINGKTYVAEDTGGSIKGKKIDIYMPSYNDCIQWGVRNVKVYLVK